jgi:hypothetical protein
VLLLLLLLLLLPLFLVLLLLLPTILQGVDALHCRCRRGRTIPCSRCWLSMGRRPIHV